MFKKKIRLQPLHENVIRVISKETGLREEDILESIFEIGLCTIVACKKDLLESNDANLLTTVAPLKQQIKNDQGYWQLATILENGDRIGRAVMSEMDKINSGKS